MTTYDTANLVCFILGCVFIFWPTAPRLIQRVAVWYNYILVNIVFALLVIRRYVVDKVPFHVAISYEYHLSAESWGKLEMMAFNCISFFLYHLILL